MRHSVIYMNREENTTRVCCVPHRDFKPIQISNCFLKVNSQQPSRSCLAGIQACYQSGIARIASNIRDPEFICKQKRSFLVCVLTPNCPATFDRGYASVIEKLDNYFSLVKYPCRKYPV
ncbi:hypothetical protein BgiBS90_027443 [Biomphalaria glabrata]|nr:hypothetical protein BgiBS90_027443 [Biomphalaria glabrata]